ncbi:ComEC family competence protein [bacterium]|nr:ComEC family competence protein [bacterium]
MGASVFWATVAGFLIGAAFSSFVHAGWFLCALCAIIAIALLFLRTRAALLCACTLIALGAGTLRMQYAAHEYPPRFEAQKGTVVTMRGRVVAEPDVRETGVRLTVMVDMLGSSLVSAPVGVLVQAPQHARASYGEYITVTGVLERPTSFDTGSGHSFNYPKYLEKDDILYQVSYAQVSALDAPTPFLVKLVASVLAIKHAFISGIVAVLPEPQSALAGGITVGDKRGLGKEWSDIFRTVGLTHVVVLSGYNIMVVIGFLDYLVRKRRGTVRLVSGVGVALLFALMTGFAASSTRAALMAGIAIVGRTLGRTYLASRALAVVGIVMLIENPYLLMFDPSFQLSMLATAGLIWVVPLCNEYLSRVIGESSVREALATTIGTQISVLPLLLYQNGLFGLYALPVNVLVLTVIPWAMCAVCVAAVVGILFGSFGTILALPAYVLLSYVLEIARFFAALPSASISIGVMPLSVLILLYVSIVFFILNQKKVGRSSLPTPVHPTHDRRHTRSYSEPSLQQLD